MLLPSGVGAWRVIVVRALAPTPTRARTAPAVVASRGETVADDALGGDSVAEEAPGGDKGEGAGRRSGVTPAAAGGKPGDGRSWARAIAPPRSKTPTKAIRSMRKPPPSMSPLMAETKRAAPRGTALS